LSLDEEAGNSRNLYGIYISPMVEFKKAFLALILSFSYQICSPPQLFVKHLNRERCDNSLPRGKRQL